MRAACYEKTGPARDVLHIRDLATPVPGRGEVRVKIAWSGVNPSDVKTRSGVRSRQLPFPQIIPHSDGAGIIDQVGPEVSPARLGEPVWIWNAAWERPCGTAAEYIVLPEIQAVRLPDTVDPAVGACLGIPALTAYHAAALDGGVAGKTVLVTGGAGAVGYYAIQFTRLLGARRIFTTVSSPEKAALARLAGADVVLNYRDENFQEALQEASRGSGMDRIIEVDLAANSTTDLAVLAPGGDIIVYGSGAAEMSLPFFPLILKDVRLHFFIVYKLPWAVRERALAHLTDLLERGSLRHQIAARLSLEQIAEAHEMVEQGQAIGNVILSP
jgi:NADPH2:quinone reductase